MMTETKSSNYRMMLKTVVAVFFIATTLISFYCRIFYGWDQDQSYLTLLATKLASGSIMFKDLWDLHQTSMIWAALFSKMFWAVKGCWDGVGIYLRVMSAFVQIAVSVFAYHELKKYFEKFSAFLVAIIIANMLPRASQQLEYGALSVWLSLIAVLLVIDINKTHRNEIFKLIVSAILYAISIFSYPTMIVSIPVIAWALLSEFDCESDNRKKKTRNFIFFFATCGAVAFDAMYEYFRTSWNN